MKQGPSISVLMTVFNGEEALSDTLDSILAQQMAGGQEFEVVIVDDGSTDRTGSILDLYRKRHQNIKVLKPGRIGRARALNIGVAACSAPYVAINDCDDLACPGRLQSQKQYLDDHPAAVLVSGWAQVVNDAGEVIGLRRPPDDDKVLRRKLAIGNPFIHSTITYRKSALLGVGGFDENQIAAIDYDMIERVARIGRLGSVRQVVIDHYRGKRQFFRSNLDPSIRWRSAAAVALRAAVHHAWWLTPLSIAIYGVTRIPVLGAIGQGLHSLHGRIIST